MTIPENINKLCLNKFTRSEMRAVTIAAAAAMAAGANEPMARDAFV